MIGSRHLPLVLLLFAFAVPVAPILQKSPARANIHACTQCGAARTSMAVVADDGLVALRVCRRCAKDFKATGGLRVIRLAPNTPAAPLSCCLDHLLTCRPGSNPGAKR